jgi:hypothetical protein
MNFEARTLSVLKNFAAINPSILFKEGSNIATISPTKTIIAKSSIKESFDREFGIYDLSKFLSTLSLMETPEITLNEKSLTIRNGNQKVNYTYCDPVNITVPPSKDIKIPSVDVEFTLKETEFNKVLKALGVLGLPELAVIGEEGKIFLAAIDSKGASTDEYRIEVGTTDKNFKMIFKSENLKLYPDDYQVKIFSKGISNFKGKEVEYFISVEANSTFG